MTFSGSLLTRRSRARILSNAFKLFSLLLCAAGISLRAQDGQSPAPVRSLIEAEMTFARMASEKGTRDSFLAFLAEDSVVFEPGPRNGRKVWTGHRPSPDVLTWRPAFVTVSQAGDLGYSTGPWEWKKEPSNPKPTAYGQFFSIWQKQKEGAWKVALDLGVDTPAPSQHPIRRSLRQQSPRSARATKRRRVLNFTRHSGRSSPPPRRTTGQPWPRMRTPMCGCIGRAFFPRSVAMPPALC